MRPPRHLSTSGLQIRAWIWMEFNIFADAFDPEPWGNTLSVFEHKTFHLRQQSGCLLRESMCEIGRGEGRWLM